MRTYTDLSLQVGFYFLLIRLSFRFVACHHYDVVALIVFVERATLHCGLVFHSV